MNASKALAAVVLASLAVACGGGGSNPPPPPGNVQFTNLTTHWVDEFYAKPSTSTDWGSVQNKSGPIDSSGGFLLTGLPPGSWDFSAVSREVESPYFAYASGDVLANQTLGLSFYNSDFTGSLSVSNESNTNSMTELYVRPTGQGDWGPNQLSASLASCGGACYSKLVYDKDPGYYDVKCVWGYIATTATWSANAVLSFSVTSIPCSPY